MRNVAIVWKSAWRRRFSNSYLVFWLSPFAIVAKDLIKRALDVTIGLILDHFALTLLGVSIQ